MEEKIREYLNTDKIFNKSILKRILRECKNSSFSDNFISYDLTTNDNENYSVHIKDKNNYKYNNYCFILKQNYPFKSPELLINNIPYNLFLKKSSVKHHQLFSKMSGLCCICCNNILSHDRWSPANTLIDIIYEINIFRTYKRNIINKIMADKIKNKYLIQDIDIDSWLF